MESKNTSTSTTVIGSSDYLKKSELPKNISSFKNDVKYISESTLENWMKEHSYINKDDINVLIEKANIKVLDNINTDFEDPTALLTLQSTIDALTSKVEELKMFSETNIEIIKNEYVTIDSSSSFANKEDVAEISKKVSGIVKQIPDTSNLASEKWVEKQGYIKEHQDISGKADITYVDEKIADVQANIPSLDGYMKEEDASKYLTEHQDISGKADITYVDEKIAELAASIPPLPDSPESPDSSEVPSTPAVSLDGYATEEWVEEQGYIKEHQDISGKADITYVDEKIAEKIDKTYVDEKIADVQANIPSLEGYATEAWIGGQGYLKDHQDISSKADISYVDKKISETLSSIPSLEGYATETWVKGQGYLKDHQDISSKADISYVDKKISTLQSSLENKTSKSYVDTKLNDMRSSIPSLEGYATEAWVRGQGYATTSAINNSLTKYAKASNVYDKKYIESNFIDIHEIQDYAKKETVESTYLPKKDIASTYITKRDASNLYLSKEDYRGLKSAATISDTYANKSYKDILAKLEEGYTLIDGFYITKDDNGDLTYMLIKNNKLQVYQGGSVTVKPQWEIDD